MLDGIEVWLVSGFNPTPKFKQVEQQWLWDSLHLASLIRYQGSN